MFVFDVKSFFLVNKKMSMIRKYHNHKLQTNPWHREEELQDIYSNKTS